MCIIIYKPKGKVLDYETVKYAQSRNKDGNGYMTSMNGNLRIKKSMSFKKLWNDYEKKIIDKGLEESLPVIWHFRIKTHGPINETNSHPFAVNKKIAFAHNGVIYGISVPKDSKLSDTALFNKEIMQQLPNDFLENKGIIRLINQYIGSTSKLAFMDEVGNVTIFNEKAGIWDDDIWYSNSSYKKVEITKKDTGTNYWGYGGNYKNVDPDLNKTVAAFCSIKIPLKEKKNFLTCSKCGMMLFEESNNNLCSWCNQVKERACQNC